jgi:hypothetical protein
MRNLIEKKKGAGIVSPLIFGVGSLIIGVVVLLVIVSTINNADLLESSSFTFVYNESANLNSSAGEDILDQWSSYSEDYEVLYVTNRTGTETIAAANYTFNVLTGGITNATEFTRSPVNVTYKFKKANTYEGTTIGISENFTAGIDNVSKQIPTILLIAAVVLLLGVLVFLVVRARQINVSGNVGGGNSSVGGIDGGKGSAIGGAGGSL